MAREVRLWAGGKRRRKNWRGGLDEFVAGAVREGLPLHEVERTILDRVLKMGKTAVDSFLEFQGDGDLGESVSNSWSVFVQAGGQTSAS